MGELFYKLTSIAFLQFLKFGQKILDFIFSFIIIYIIYKISCNFFKGIFNKKVLSSRLEGGHLDTIKSLVLSIIKYSFATIVVLLFIQNFVGAIGVTITSIIGVALGFASQNVLKDLLNGILITFENQFTVGDYITINKGRENISGTVEVVRARIIKLKDFNGDYHIISNGFINQVTNHSRRESRVLVDIKVDSLQKSDYIFGILNDAIKKVHNEDITVEPYVYGVVDSNEVSTTYRVIGYSKPLSHCKIENELRKVIMDELLDKNAVLPVNRHSIFKN